MKDNNYAGDVFSTKPVVNELIPRFISMPLAAASGASVVLSFSPFAYPLLVFPGLTILYVLLTKTLKPMNGFLLGWLWGLGALGVGVFWLRNSIAQFGGLNLPLAIALTLLFGALIAIFFGLVGWLSVKTTGKQKQLLWLLFPLFWVFAEWLRGWLWSGFPWLTLGYSQIDTPLAGLAPIGGVYLISLAVAFTAVGLYHWQKAITWVALLTLWGGCFFLAQVQWTQADGKVFTASLVQGNIEQKKKWQANQLIPTVQHYQKLSSNLTDSQLIVWPETAIPAFSYRLDAAFLQPLHQQLSVQDQDLLLGIPVKETDDRYYNAMLSFGRSGQSYYYKKHLVPFGEFMPLVSLMGPIVRMLDIPMSSFSAGNSVKPLIQLAGHTAGISICYEDVFGDEIAMALPEARFLINASNDAWFGDSLAPHQHLQMARMRALETGRYLLRATNTGISAVIGAKGEVLAKSPQFQTTVLTHRVQPLKGTTPYVDFIHWL